MSSIDGLVSPGYEAIAEAFDAAMADEVGAACAICVAGETVIDLWGGAARVSDPWTRNTIVPVFSVSKGIAAVCILHLAEQGLINLDAPLAAYWDEFAHHGKGEVTVRAALAHRAGVPYITGTFDLGDLASATGMATRLAAQEPWFEPGTAHAYHPVTVGWITSELVRRVTGMPIGRWLAQHVSERLGLSLYMGLPPERHGQVARLQSREPAAMAARMNSYAEGSPEWQAMTLGGLISLVPESDKFTLNDPELQSVELAGAGMIGDARSLASFYSACVVPIDGTRLLSDAAIEDAVRPVSTGTPFGQAVSGPSWGAGVMIPWAGQPMLGETSFGHDGFGGSLAFADLRHRVGFGYVRNSLAVGGVTDPQVYAVVDALRKILN